MEWRSPWCKNAGLARSGRMEGEFQRSQQLGRKRQPQSQASWRDAAGPGSRDGQPSTTAAQRTEAAAGVSRACLFSASGDVSVSPQGRASDYSFYFLSVLYPRKLNPSPDRVRKRAGDGFPQPRRGPRPPAGPPVSPHSPLHPPTHPPTCPTQDTPTGAAIPDDIKVDILHFQDQNAICF